MHAFISPFLDLICLMQDQQMAILCLNGLCSLFVSTVTARLSMSRQDKMNPDYSAGVEEKL